MGVGGGGEGGEVQKKIFAQGKIKCKKNSCTPINPKKIFILWPKKNSYKEFYNEKKFLQLEIYASGSKKIVMNFIEQRKFAA